MSWKRGNVFLTTGFYVSGYGMIFILCKMYIYDFGYGLIHYIILSAFIIPVIYTTVLMNKGNASYFACVVYLSIVVNHLIDENPFVFVINRSLDTLIGIMLGLFVNSIHFHGKGNKNILFVVDYPGYSYMKIYNKNASVENMIDYLKEKLHKDNIITFGDYDSRYDTDYKGYDCNEIVNALQKKYYSNKLYL